MQVIFQMMIQIVMYFLLYTVDGTTSGNCELVTFSAREQEGLVIRMYGHRSPNQQSMGLVEWMNVMQEPH